MRFLLKNRIALAGNGEYSKKESVKEFAIVVSILPVVLMGFAFITPVFLAGAIIRGLGRIATALF